MSIQEQADRLIQSEYGDFLGAGRQRELERMFFFGFRAAYETMMRATQHDGAVALAVIANQRDQLRDYFGAEIKNAEGPQ